MVNSLGTKKDLSIIQKEAKKEITKFDYIKMKFSTKQKQCQRQTGRRGYATHTAD